MACASASLPAMVRLKLDEDASVQLVGDERLIDHSLAVRSAPARRIEVGSISVLERVGVGDGLEVIEAKAVELEVEHLGDEARDVLAPGEVAQVADVVVSDERRGIALRIADASGVGLRGRGGRDAR